MIGENEINRNDKFHDDSQIYNLLIIWSKEVSLY